MYYKTKTDIALPFGHEIKQGELLENVDGNLYYQGEPICPVDTEYCREYYEEVDV